MQLSFLLKLALISLLSLTLVSCATQQHKSDSKMLTLGLVQQSIKPGISSVKVLEVLGSPNIVKKSADSVGEVWVYDKISTTRKDSSLGINIAGGGSDGGALLGGSNSSSESSSKSLTVIIKFDENDAVKKVSYLRSAF